MALFAVHNHNNMMFYYLVMLQIGLFKQLHWLGRALKMEGRKLTSPPLEFGEMEREMCDD
jgi:hypothetical protein